MSVFQLCKQAFQLSVAAMRNERQDSTYKQGEGFLELGNLLFGERISLRIVPAISLRSSAIVDTPRPTTSQYRGVVGRSLMLRGWSSYHLEGWVVGERRRRSGRW